MADMLVKLYNLPPLEPVLARQREEGVEIRRALAAEKHMVINWVAKRFSPLWISECDVAFAQVPIACLIAVDAAQRQLFGFTCYDAVCRNFFGPVGVDEAQRGRGIGKALLLKCLHEMAAQGYAYAIIPWVGPKEFYANLVGAIEIEGSEPGVYGTLLKY
ncbi:MAG: GNAT family N-acetyltransferase [Anaerolineae bacterium]|nr:GNAT family N-acetyltransferase [Anaerolineae bacterium]